MLKNSMKASQIAKAIEKEAPRALAESWDNPGFQIGSVRKEVNKILTTLDIDINTVEFALRNDVDMIVSHHPFFFSNLKRIDNDSQKGKLIEEIIKNDLIVYSAHTNIDKAEKGLNTFVAKKLGLIDIKPLSPERERYYKFVVYVPENSAEKILDELFTLEVGKTGEKYQNCTFQIRGKGTFQALEGANPAIGSIDSIETVEEVRIETLVRKSQIEEILRLLDTIHPYEEYAYDIIPEEIFSKKAGLGSIGKLKHRESTETFLDRIFKIFQIDTLREAGPRPKSIKKVALCTGAGAEFIQRAKFAGADVYLTGDLKHHDAQRAVELGLWVLDIGHFETEKFVTALFEEILQPLSDVEIIKYQPEYGFLKTTRKNL